MERSASAPATAREVILEIVRNMREGLEPLNYSTLAPSVYHVYLHPSDFDRLRAIIPRIVDEARRALTEEAESLNRASLSERLGEKLKIGKRGEPKISVPEGGWQIRILENTDDDVDAGDIVIYSELAMPVKQEFGSGAMTKRIATRRMAGAPGAAQQSFETAAAQPPSSASAPPSPAPAKAAAEAPAAATVPITADAAYAVIEYEDNGGRKQYRMTKDEIVAGRGGRDYWTDIKFDTLPDVSREHFRLRRDPATGAFFLKDLSRLGTTVNGEKAPSSVDFTGGEKRDLNLEAPVPAQARIGLAGVLFLEFRSTANG